MADEVTFLDIAVLLKITPNTPLEKLGSLLNASIFDASNLAGTLKQKNLIEFSAYYPGPNSITVTETGKALIADADAKSALPFDALDDSILKQLSGGKRAPVELQSTLNLRPKDLAMRLYKENKQGFITYELKNATVDIMMTEKGFLRAKGGVEPAVSATMPSAPATPSVTTTTTTTTTPPPVPAPPAGWPAQAQQAPVPPAQHATSPMPKIKPKMDKKVIIIVVLVVILVIAFVLTRYVL